MIKDTSNKRPPIRVRGFDEDWQDKQIGEILSEVKRSIVLEDNQQYELITVKRRNEGIISRGYLFGRDILVKNYSRLEAGDFLISKRQVVHGATGIVPANLDKAIVSNEYLVATGNDDISTEFLTIISSLSEMKRKFLLSSYGVDIEKLFFDAEDWKKRTVTIPKKTEQIEICSFFKELNYLIQLHQRKYDKLVTIKQAMLQKMFPQDGASIPEIRFKGFEGDWEVKQVYQVSDDSYGGGTPKTSDARFWKGDIPWIQSSDLIDTELYNVKPRKWINEMAINKSATKLIPKNSIAIVTRVGVGKLALVSFDYTTSQDFLSLCKLKIDDFFAVVALSILLKSKLCETQGTSIKGITKDEILGYSFMVPSSVAEQSKIGTYFRKLDELIANHAIQLEKLKQLKSACLAKMFV